MKKISVLYDSVSQNTGDIAIGIALQQGMSRRGFDVEVINPYTTPGDAEGTMVIGGGQLLRDPGDEFYDHFRVKGKHILNSVGVSGIKDFEYLDSYEIISARTTHEAEILQSHIKKRVQVSPCTTTILESAQYEIQGLSLAEGEKVVGIHLVPDVLIRCPNIISIINNIPHKKIFIPFTHYNQDASFMRNMPFDMSNVIILDKLKPLELHSVIAQMDFVLVSSLHASIFAYTQNVPFISMFQQKVYDYFKDRGLEHYIYQSEAQLMGLLSEIEKKKPDMQRKIAADKRAVNSYLDEYARILNEDSSTYTHDSGNSPELRIKAQDLYISQLEGVVEKRDVLIHNQIYENMRNTQKKVDELMDIIHTKSERVNELEEKLGFYERKFNPRYIAHKIKSKIQKKH